MATSEFVPQPARYAIFVDAGYLYAASGALLLGCSSRREYRVAAEKLIKALTSHADEQLLGELLRVYWFDAAPKRQPTVDQRVIANLPLVKLRLGNLNAQGQQKGVDAQLRADLEALARHRAITDAVLLAGDEDMLPAVEAAQRYGVRVHLWGVEPTHGSNQAEWLVWESDTVEVLQADFLRPYFTKAKALPVPAPPAAVPGGGPVERTPVPSPAQVFAGRVPSVRPVPAAA
ncbi:NYN domain-containing protein, partial [Actinomadura kijaniata]|uniref:NYN domain-containing protein n=1 Tax=Actinomadura kijaniata TaxID=46161 RepID=UPI003F1B5C80